MSQDAGVGCAVVLRLGTMSCWKRRVASMFWGVFVWLKQMHL